MNLLESLLGWFAERAERGRQKRAAQKLDDPHVAAATLRWLQRHPDKQEVVVDGPHGKALFSRGDVPRLAVIAKGVGERVFAHAMMGGTAYGFPGGWSQDRIEQVLHLKSWVYIAQKRIWDRIARLDPCIGWVNDGPEPGTRLKAQLADWRHRKSLGALKPHEQVTPCPAHHPLVKLLGHPNKHDVAFDLWSELGIFLELTGNAYLWAVPTQLGVLDRSYKACELWVLPSHWVWPRVGKDKLIEYYEVRPWIGPGMLRFPAEDVIHLRFKSPIHKIDGYSPQTAGAEWIDTSESVNRSRFFQFKNGSFPLGSIKLGDRYADIDDEDLERLYAKLFGRFQGESNYGRAMILPPDAEYAPLQINPTEMAYTQSADQLRDWILALWAVPKEVAGIQDAGSEIAMYGPLRQFAENCLIPRLTYLGQALTSHLAHRWDKSLRIWWPDPSPDDPQQKREDLKMRYDTQSITSNEIRSAYGDPPLAGGDEISDPRPNLPPPGMAGDPPGTPAPQRGGRMASVNGNGHA